MAAVAVVEGTGPCIAGPEHASITAAEACHRASPPALSASGTEPTAHAPHDAAALQDTWAELPAHPSYDTDPERVQPSAGAVAGAEPVLGPDTARVTEAESAAGAPDQAVPEADGSAWQQQRPRRRQRQPDGGPVVPEQPSGCPAASGHPPSALDAPQQPLRPQALAVQPAASAGISGDASPARSAAASQPVASSQHTPAQQRPSRQASHISTASGDAGPSTKGTADMAAPPGATSANAWQLPDAAAAPSWQEV